MFVVSLVFYLLKNMFYSPLLVLKGNFRWNYLLKQVEGDCHLLAPNDLLVRQAGNELE